MVVKKFGFLVFLNCFWRIHASYHWVVTENSKIQPQVENSGFPIMRSHDLLTFLEQEKRLITLNNLYKELLTLKKSIGTQWSKIESEGDLEKRLYSTDIDCLMGGRPLSQHDLNTEFIDYGQGSRPKMKDGFQHVEPDCRAYSDLDFSMRTFPHLDTLNKRDNINSFVSSVSSSKVFSFNIDAMLKENSSDWTAYNIASLYWRAMGNGTNAVECARRALYYSPLSERYLVLLNLGTLLQELQSLGEAAIVLHSAVDHNPEQHISHLALGNVYAALGDYRRSVACYDNVLSLNPGNIRALQLKHALLCRKKLESGLLGTHSLLQTILQDLQKHNIMQEKLSLLQNQVNWDKASKVKEIISQSQPLYLNLKMLLENVEQQAKTLSEEVSKKVPKKKQRVQGGEEKNRIKLEPVFNCDSEECPSYARSPEKGEGKSKSPRAKDSSGLPTPALETGQPSGPDHSLKDKMTALINLLQSEYEQEITLVDLKNRINDRRMRHQKAVREFDEGETFPLKDTIVLNNFDGCVKDSNDVKKLN